MKNIQIFALMALLALAACTPKAGDKMGGTKPGADFRSAAPAAGPAPKIQIGKAETFKLDNGLSVIVVENRKLPKVNFQLFVDYDPVMEKEAAGYLEMMGGLLSKGTKTRSKVQIDEEIDFIGASMSSSANGLFGSCLSKHSEKLLAVMSDVLLNPTFPQEEFDKDKRRAESGLAQQKTDANAIAGNVASILRYGKKHPYGENMTEETLAKITTAQMVKHYETYFKPNISYLVVTGDITKAQAEQYAKKYFGAWKGGQAPKHMYDTPRGPEVNQVDFVHKPGAVQSVIRITYPVDLKPGVPDVIRSRVMNAILGGYFNSRVNANLREGHGWTYGANTSLNSDKLVGYFSAGAAVRNAVTDSSIIEFLKEMRRMRDEKVPNSELQVVKNVITGQFSQSLEQPGTVASFALNTARYGLPADYYEKYLEVLQSVSPEDVMAMAKKYIHPDKAHILVVGNREDVSERLKQFSPEGKINFYDAQGNPVKTNNAAVPAGMTAEKVVEDYVNALGGTAKIGQLKEVETKASMSIGGQSMSVNTWQKGGNKVAMEIGMNGQIFNKRVYDGAAAQESGMGGTRALEGEELMDLKEQAAFCKEANYAPMGYKLTLKGVEEVNGSSAYVVEVLRPDGKKVTEYYDMKSSLKLRETSSVTGQDGNPAEMTIEYADYKAVNGVLFPYTMKIVGMMPIPVTSTISELKVNGGLDDKIFSLK
jgi:predicted Zn-dependent peptidase